jgi:23S rRNA pseudouridine1911/1915/1917 synthase
MTVTESLIMALVNTKMNRKKTVNDSGSFKDSKIVQTLTVEGDTIRLDHFLARAFPAESRSALQRWIKDGRVHCQSLSGLKASSKLTAKLIIRVQVPPPPPPPSPIRAEDIPIPILFQDDHILVVNKCPGLVVHPGPGTPNGTLVNALLALGGPLSSIGGAERPGIVHRLDKDTSGVMIIARNDKAHRFLSDQFKERKTSKIYRALVRGAPPDSGTINRPLGRHIKDRKKQAVRYDGGRPSVSHYEVKERFGHVAALAEIRIETGRTHQIRVHMSSIGHGVLADQTYGRSKHPRAEASIARQALHAAILAINHPASGQRLRFEAALPEDLEDAIQTLKSLTKKDIR